MISSLFKLFKIVFLIITTSIFCLLASLAVVVFILDNDQQNHLITSILSIYTNSEVKSDRLHFFYRDGSIRIEAQQLTWKTKNQYLGLHIDRTEITLPLASIITPPLFLSSVVLTHPTIDLSKYPVRDRIKSNGPNNTLTAHLFNQCNIIVKNGSLLLPQNIRFSNIEINTTRETTSLRHVKIQARGKWQDALIPFTINGTIDSFVSPYGINLQLVAGSLPLSRIKINDQLKFNRGTMAIRSQLSSVPGTNHLSINSDIDLSHIQFLIRNSSREKRYQFNHLSARVTAEYNNGLLTLHPSSLKNDKINLHLSGRLDLKPTSPYVSISLASEVMAIGVLKQLIPDPLLGHWLTTELFPLFSNGQAILNNLTIQGSLEELSNMDQPENRRSLSLDLILKKTDITLEKPDIVFTDSSGHLEIKKGLLLVSNIQGTMAGTTVQQGSYQIDDLYEEEMTSRFGVNCTTTLTDLARVSSVSFMPDQLKKDGRILNDYSGHVQADIQAHFKPSYQTVHFDRFETTLSDVSSKALYQDSPLTFGKITISRDDHSRNVLTGSARWKETDFHLSGFFRDDTTGSVTIQTSLDLPTLFPFLQKSHDPFESTIYEQALPAKIVIHKQDDGFLLDGHVTLPALSMVSYSDNRLPLTNGELALNLTTGDWRTLKIENFTIAYNHYILKGTGQANLDEMKMKLNIHSPESVYSFNNRGKLEKEKRKSPLQADLTLDINLDQPDKSKIFGTLQGRGLTFPLPGLVSPAVDAEFDLAFSGNRIDFRKCNFFLEHNLDGDPLHVQGFLERDEQLKGVLLVDSKFIHANDIFTNSPDTQQQTIDETEEHYLSDEQGIIISAKVEKLAIKGTLISPFYLQGYLANNRFYPVKMAARMKNGQLGMTTNPDANQEKNLQFYFFIKDQELEGLSRFLSNSDNRDIKGRLSGGGIIHASGNSFEKLRSRLEGEISFHIQEATLKGDYILVRILELLSVENLFSKKADYAEEGDLYMKSMSGNLSIDNSILTSKDIFIDTIAFDATGDLKIDLQTKTIESHLAVSPFGTVDTIVSTIPIIGHILTGKDKSLVSYHFQITGSTQEPEISYLPLEDIPTALLGYAKRLLSPSTYLFFTTKSKNGLDYDKVSRELVTEIERSFESNHDLLKDRQQ